ncbi:MAG: GNAT family N-acetyltransferase [Sphingomonas adhaesiva]|uniref:GNAT family N-acetyltransferase n=1 Tax=Sphingomonas adhaesiva TaxID=28212 RepID=UPI002FF6494D
MIVTDRLVLRRWRRDDILPFHAMGQDQEVMRYLGPPMSIEECVRVRRRMNAIHGNRGHSFWALERRADNAFIGFCGLMPGTPPIDGQVEVGWRLARGAWGQGLAGEAARATLKWAWEHLSVPAIVAVTVPANRRSRALMERLGMERLRGGDFGHPDHAAGHPLHHQIRYAIARPAHV